MRYRGRETPGHQAQDLLPHARVLPGTGQHFRRETDSNSAHCQRGEGFSFFFGGNFFWPSDCKPYFVMYTCVVIVFVVISGTPMGGTPNLEKKECQPRQGYPREGVLPSGGFLAWRRFLGRRFMSHTNHVTNDVTFITREASTLTSVSGLLMSFC